MSKPRPARRALGASQIRSQANQHPRRYPATPAVLPPNKKPPAINRSLRVSVAFKSSSSAVMALRALILCFSNPGPSLALCGPVTPSAIAGQVPAGPIFLRGFLAISEQSEWGCCYTPTLPQPTAEFRHAPSRLLDASSSMLVSTELITPRANGLI